MATKRDQAVIDLVINGRSAETSIKAIQKATYDTERLLRNMSKAADPVAYEKLKQELHQLQSALSGMNGELRQQSTQLKTTQSDWQKFVGGAGSILSGVVGGNLVTAGIGKVLDLASRAPKEIAKIADEMTNVGKTTGLADDEVQHLFDSFQEMDTRSTRTELAELGEIAGKLGESTLEGAEGFVKGADIIKVALAKDLGGNAEEAVTKIAKIIEIFNLKQQFGIQDSFMKVGSAINSLGASSSASEEYIVNFTTRMAGIAPTAKISVPDVLGLAAAMDQLGQSPELASTNIGKMLIALGKDVPYFSKVAGMSVKEFSTLLKNDANEAFLRVIEGASKSGKGLEGLAGTFKTLGIEGSEGAQVIGALSGKIDLVRESQRQANEEFNAGTSVIDEYNRANNNSAAILDKIGKKIDNLWMLVKDAGDPIIRFLGGVFGVVDPLQVRLSELNETGDKAARTAQQLQPLIDKYEKLKQQAKDGKDVQKELNEVTRQIASIAPTAATGWDTYGNAIGIASDKVREFLGLQRQVAKDSKAEQEKQLMEYLQVAERIRKRNQEILNSGKTPRKFSLQSRLGEALGISDEYRPSTEKEIQAQRKQLKESIDYENNLRKQLQDLQGSGKETPKVTPAKDDGKGKGGKGGGYTGAGPGKQEVDEFRQIKEEIRKLREEAQLDVLNQNERELQVVKFKYEQLRKLANGNKDYLSQLAELEKKDLARLEEKQTEKAGEEADKRLQKANEVYQKQQEEAAKKADEFAQKQNEALTAIDNFGNQSDNSEKSQELTATDKKFQTLLAQSEEAKLTIQQTTPLWEAYWAQRAAIEDKYYEKSKEKTNQQRLHQIEQVGKLTSSIGDIFSSFFEIAASNETEYAEFKKMSTLVQIAVDTASAIASITSRSAATSVTPIDMAIRIATGIATILANIAKAKQVLSDTKAPAQPKFQKVPTRATGGPTDLLSLYMDNSGRPEGMVRQPTLFNLGNRSYIAGEPGKNGIGGMEYVFSNPMLQNPIHANFVAMTEALRMSGYDFTKRADMRPAENSSGSAEMAGMMSLLIEEQRATRQAMQQFAKKPWNYRHIEETQELLDYIKTAHSA